MDDKTKSALIDYMLNTLENIYAWNWRHSSIASGDHRFLNSKYGGHIVIDHSFSYVIAPRRIKLSFNSHAEIIATLKRLADSLAWGLR